MSIVITTDVFCDGPDCLQWTHGCTGPKPNAITARGEAARVGWTKRFLRDYCPKCSKIKPKDMRALQRLAAEGPLL